MARPYAEYVKKRKQWEHDCSSNVRALTSMSKTLVKAAEVLGDSEFEMQAKISSYQDQLQAVFAS